MAFANCEFASTLVDFHTIAGYGKSTDFAKFNFVDDDAFISAPLVKSVNTVVGASCEKINSKYFEGDKPVRNVLKISGCNKDTLSKGDFALHKNALYKLTEVSGTDLSLSKEQAIELVKRFINSKIIDLVKYDTPTDAVGNLRKNSQASLASNKIEVKQARSFTVNGKEIIWYALEATIKYSRQSEQGTTEYVSDATPAKHAHLFQDTTMPMKAVTTYKTITENFEETLPISIYQFDEKIHFFGNGLSNECGHEEVEEAKSENRKVQFKLPYFIPDKLFILNNEILILSSKSLSWSYEWILKTGEFSVIKNPYDDFPN